MKISNTRYALLVALSTLASACAHMRPIATIPAVSMSPGADRSIAGAKEIGPVTARYCRGEDAQSGGGNVVGLMDEVIYRAQKASGARYIRQATFMSDGTCIALEGVAMK